MKKNEKTAILRTQEIDKLFSLNCTLEINEKDLGVCI